MSNGPGFFQLPQSDFSGSCNDQNFVGFEVNTRSPISCTRHIDVSTSTSFANQCEREQSLSRYVTDLYLARSAEIQASSGVSSAADVTPIRLTKVLYYDRILDMTTDVTADFVANNCASTFFEDISFSSSIDLNSEPCLFASNETWAALQSADFTYSATNISPPIMLCASMVRDVYYHVNHSASARATLQDVTAEVVITDLAAAAGASDSASLVQSFAVAFTSANNAQRSADNGNLVTRYVFILFVCFKTFSCLLLMYP